uniref:KH domain-containing protein n=1 Tax=Caenorhabditis japonica TaxID=281687 RepID=A0A8R1HP60_CAEJA
TECVIRSYTPEELDVEEHFQPDGDWVNNFQSNDWFSDQKEDCSRKITYLMVRTNDEKSLQMVRLKIIEIIEETKQQWKSTQFLVDSHVVGYLVGRGGRNIKNLRDKFNVQIDISDPNPENPLKSTVTVNGRDLQAMKELEIVMKETVLPRNYNRMPRAKEETFEEDLEKELEELRNAGEVLAKGFY